MAKTDENIRSFMLTEEQHAFLTEYADRRNISVSQAMSLAFLTWLDKKPVTVNPTVKRVTVWMDPNLYHRFRLRLGDMNAKRPTGAPRVTIREAIGEILEGMR